MKNTWFSSDWHLSHNNILKYDNRPFSTIEEHDKTIIENILKTTNIGDDLYFLGDFAFTNDKQKLTIWFEDLSDHLNLFFIAGNHDNYQMKSLYRTYGTYLGELAEIKVNEQSIVLCHYAMRVWNKSHRGTWQLYGHSHHSLQDDKNALSIDVGINGKDYNYKPLEFNQIKDIMSKKEFKSIDHHR